LTVDQDEDERRRLLAEKIVGVIPAIAVTDKGRGYHVGILIATNVLIVAFLNSFKNWHFASTTPRYYALQREWGSYLQKPVASIMLRKEYRCYVIPYSNITHFSVNGKGRFRKRCVVVFHTPQQQFVFSCVTSKEIVSKDLTGFFREAGVRFSPGGMS